MKNIKYLCGFALLLCVLLVPTVKADEISCVDITNEEGLKSALTDISSNCTNITLKNSIELKSPIEITKEVAIDGKGNTISAATDFAVSGNNGTLLTAKDSGAKVTLKNLTLSGATKYGAQAYNGGELTLEGVTIKDCKFGGVLANGGKVTIKDLHLGNNGTGGNNGIEISVGQTVTEDHIPEVVMDGKLESDEAEGVINVATNDTNLKNYTVTNTPNTTNKLYVENGGVVVTNQNNEVLYTGNPNTNIISTQATKIHKVSINYNGQTITLAVEDGKTLASVATKLAEIKNAVAGKVFSKFVTETGEDFDENAVITTDLILTAVYVDLPANPDTSDINLYLLLSLIAVSGCGVAYTIKRRFN